MAVLIDPPNFSGRGRLWSHLASDRSLEELHLFARSAGIPDRGFDRDHYDVPADRYRALVALGAQAVSSRDLVARLNAAGLRRRKPQSLGRRSVGQPLLRARRLRSGDTVAVVAPSGPVSPEALSAGTGLLESWGLRVRLGAHADGKHPRLEYLAADDVSRADDLMRAWTDPQVAAVFAARGGYGAQRMVDLLGWTQLAAVGPKVFCGFSDITALHQAFASVLGLATLHGPTISALAQADKDSAEHLRRTLFEPDRAVEVTDPDRPGTPMQGGAAEGILVGGNLTLLAAELGSPTSRPARDSIVVLEDVGEEAYRIDRSLTSLLRAGWFTGVRGIAAGQWSDSVKPESVRGLLLDRLGGLGVPMLWGLPCGHGTANRTIALGVRARLDADAGTLRLLTPALV
jgi:muramoyltetrapeptide carboxypeptidase